MLFRYWWPLILFLPSPQTGIGEVRNRGGTPWKEWCDQGEGGMGRGKSEDPMGVCSLLQNSVPITTAPVSALLQGHSPS